jgi:hypothetical protein
VLGASSAMRLGFSGAMRADSSKLSAAVEGKVVHGGEGTIVEAIGAMKYQVSRARRAWSCWRGGNCCCYGRVWGTGAFVLQTR